jgi:putative ABC transport system ATP-binding protein
VNAAVSISLESVVREYATPAGVVRAINGVTLRLAAGRSLAITGPSGCGKSTLLGLIAGLEPPSAGRVVIGDVEISSMSERERVRLRRHELGLIFQADNLLPFLSAVENVALQLALCGVGDRYERCSELLAELGLADHQHKLPDQLSGGQRQRVAVAGALIKEPRVILADEPTGSLDADNSSGVIDLLLDAQRNTGATLVVVTHDAAVAERMDENVRLRDGQLAEDPECARV